MSEDLKNKFNVLAKCVDLQDKAGKALASKMTLSHLQKLKESVMNGGQDFAVASRLMQDANEISVKGPDVVGYKKSIEVLQNLIVMGDKNIGRVLKIVGEDICKLALQNDIDKNILEEVSSMVEIPNTKKLFS